MGSNLGVSPVTAFVADESGLPLAALAEETLVAVTAPCMAIFRHPRSLSGASRGGALCWSSSTIGCYTSPRR